ncbi:hypothetical protein DFH09DRAFT_1293851 [Mycena vulgaris]|nr:hypothetical protein DFH09DRAFT_1293851 [Mycena vulgaris]
MAASNIKSGASSPSQLGKGSTFRPFQPSSPSTSDWLAPLIWNAKGLAAGAEILPFPYVKGICGTVVFLLETVDKVKKNRDSMKELCGDAVEIITIIQDQISAHGDTAALTFKSQCEELEEIFHGRQTILDKINQYFMQSKGVQKIFLLYGLGGAGKT